MRAFVLACVAAGMIAAGTAVLLDRFAQQSAATAFTASSARIEPSDDMRSGRR
jgi:hypothetical protein